jgi:hypothetical protein
MQSDLGNDELVEKVARAIYEAEDGTAWDRSYEGTKDDYRGIARAALAAWPGAEINQRICSRGTEYIILPLKENSDVSA